MFLRRLKKGFIITSLVICLINSTGFTYAEELKTATITANTLNLRQSPSTSSIVIDKLTKGNTLKVLSTSNGWCKVTKDGKTGWLYAKYVSLTAPSNDLNINLNNSVASNEADNETITPSKSDSLQSASLQSGIVTGNNVNFRNGPGLNCSIITKLNKGEKLSILEKADGWYKAESSDGKIGWISTSYISLSDTTTTAKPSEDSGSEISRGGFPLESHIVDYAKSFVGVKYTYGGTTPDTGFDCSGFTKYVFAKVGIKLERVAADQAKQGTEVKRDELLPGDLVFSDTDGGNNNISHVGIYIGENKFISASSGSTTGKVVIQDMNSTYWKATYMTARRVY